MAEKCGNEELILLAIAMKATQDVVRIVRIKLKKDRYGLLMWLLWTRRIIAFKLYFCYHKFVFKEFSFSVRDDQRFCCQEETIFEFRLPSIIAHFPKGKSPFLFQFVLVVG